MESEIGWGAKSRRRLGQQVRHRHHHGPLTAVAGPKGAWGEWGRGYVYFVSRIAYGKGQVGIFGVYAIDPTEDASVKLVVRFPRGMNPRGFDFDRASCVILGSRVYITMYGEMWFYDIGGGGGVADEWKKSRKFNGRSMCNPYLFTLKGNLYALNVDMKQRSKFDHNFQVKFKRGWVSLPDPPTLCTNEVEYHTVSNRSVLAISCIGDSKVIFHLSTTHFVTCYEDDADFHKQHFLCYTLEHGFVGEWTRINLDCIDSVFRMNSAYLSGLSCRSHLLTDDILLLTMPGCKLGAYGLSGLHLKHLDPDLADLNDKLPHDINNLLLVEVSPRRYLAIAFSKSADFSVITFELIHSPPSLRAEIISITAELSSGTELPLPLGIAYSSA